MKSTNALMADHEVMLNALRILDAIDDEIRQGTPVSRDDIQSLLAFLREFADGIHHVKEQAILFPALMLAGMPADVGPLEKMNNEHERGRTLAIAMQDSLNRNRMDDFLAYSSRYIDLLKNHIAKEEDVLFAKAELILSGEEDEQIAADFDRFQSTIVGNQTRQRLC